MPEYIYAVECDAVDPGVTTECGRLASHQTLRRFETVEEYHRVGDAIWDHSHGRRTLVKHSYNTVRHLIGYAPLWSVAGRLMSHRDLIFESIEEQDEFYANPGKYIAADSVGNIY